MNKVFLGGTCGCSDWREILTPMLDVDFFNPVVDDWNEECIAIDNDEKENKCNIHLYVITSDMQGVYSIAEAVMSSVTPSKQTIFFVMSDGFDKHQLKSLNATSELLNKNGAICVKSNDLSRLARIINNCYFDRID